MSDIYNRLHREAEGYDLLAASMENTAKMMLAKARELRTIPLRATPDEATAVRLFAASAGIPPNIRIVEHSLILPE